MLTEYFTTEIYATFLVFCRIGTALMVLPVFNAPYISPRIRLILAIAISIVVSPMIEGMPKPTGEAIITLFDIFSEVTIGFMIGAIARIIASAIHVAGMIMSMQAALAQAVLFDPNQGAQGALFGNILELMALTLIFIFNMHHIMIYALVDSYSIFKPGDPIPIADFAELASVSLAKAFTVGVQLASPLIVSGMLINLSSGLLARLMPAFQVFFVVMPAQIMISLFVFMATMSAALMWYLNYFGDAMENFLTF